MKKKVIRFIIIAVLILGVYYGAKVTPVEEKRAQATLDNLESLEAVNFKLEGGLEDSREGFYDLQTDGYIDEEKGKGDFSLSTRIEGAEQEINGEFIYSDPNLYLNFNEDGLPIVLEGFFRDNFEYEIEEVRNQWVRLETDLKSPEISIVEEGVEILAEDEEIGDKEMYNYNVEIKTPEFFEESLVVEIFTGKEDLNLYRTIIDKEIELSERISFPEPFLSFSAGSSPTLKLDAEFSNFNEKEEVEIPEEYLEL
ncbi:MAG: hypothetical protein ACQEP3_02860 [Patescibacteria group bacterium]